MLNKSVILNTTKTLELKNSAQLIELLGCHYNSFTKQATFVIWAPHQHKRTVILEILHPVFSLNNKSFTYSVTFIEMQQHEDFYLAVVDHLQPYIKPGRGDLYRFYSPHQHRRVPDIYSRYQPFGVYGPSAIININKHSRKNNFNKPHSITKLHIGTASASGTFVGLHQLIKTQRFFNHLDAIEFLPLGPVPGQTGYDIVESHNTILIEKISDYKPLNWGYDGGPNFLLAINEGYGHPQELQNLIKFLHHKNIKVGFDIQLNHFGPEGIHHDWYGPYYHLQENAWGKKLNYQHPEVRKIFLAKLKEFIQIYQPDFLRLDMSSRYEDNLFIKEICNLYPGLPVILEDERHDPWLTDSQGGGATAQWSFDLVHSLKRIRQKHYGELPQVIDTIINKSFHYVVFPDYHDEQGNGNAQPLQDYLTPALTSLTNGIEMSWLALSYFHFFFNYPDKIQQIRVTAEKAPLLNELPDNIWPLLKSLHPHFETFQQCRDFFSFIHYLWRTEVQPFTNDIEHKYRNNIQTWINNNAKLTEICYAYGQAIFELSNNKNKLVSLEYQKFIKDLKKFRKANAWLYTQDTQQNKFNLDQNTQTVFIQRQNNQHNAILIAALGNAQKLELKIPAGKWIVAASNFKFPLQGLIKKETIPLWINLPAQGIIILYKK